MLQRTPGRCPLSGRQKTIAIQLNSWQIFRYRITELEARLYPQEQKTATMKLG
jgi:hypothetical protein